MRTEKRPTLGRLALTLAMIAFLVGLAAMDAGAEQRLVIVNGQALTAKQLSMLDNLAGGDLIDHRVRPHRDARAVAVAGVRRRGLATLRLGPAAPIAVSVEVQAAARGQRHRRHDR